MDTQPIDAFWSDTFFGCPPGAYAGPANAVCAHRHLAGYAGFFILRIHEKYVLSVPPPWLPQARKIAENPELDLFSQAVWADHLPEFRYIGPAWVGYADAPPPAPPEDIALLPPGQAEEALHALARACGPEAWGHSGIDGASEAIAAKYDGERLVSAAGYHLWGKTIAHIGIVTDPAYRGRGYARQVLARITADILQKGLIPQYRTLCANGPAIRAAKACGFAEYARHISLRFL